jgi:hypothetical protein
VRAPLHSPDALQLTEYLELRGDVLLKLLLVLWTEEPHRRSEASDPYLAEARQVALLRREPLVDREAAGAEARHD